MRKLLVSASLALLALSAASPAAALDNVVYELRIDASLALPPRLTPPDYWEVIKAPRPMTTYRRMADPSAVPFGETGIWKVRVPIRVEVLAFVITDEAWTYLLFLDNFAVPAYSRSTVHPTDIFRSIGIR